MQRQNQEASSQELKESELWKQFVETLIPNLKEKPPGLNLEQETKLYELKKSLPIRQTMNQDQLFAEIEALEKRQTYILKELNNKLDASNQELKKTEHELKNAKQILNAANATIAALHQEINLMKNNKKKWRYALALLGIVVGGALCASGAGLLAGATILGISTIVLGGCMALGDASYVGYNIYQDCKSDRDPPDSSSTQGIANSLNIPLDSTINRKEATDPASPATKPVTDASRLDEEKTPKTPGAIPKTTR